MEIGKMAFCEVCNKQLELEITNFRNLRLTYWLPKHYNHVGKQCGNSFKTIYQTVVRLKLAELMTMPIEDISMYTGYVCGDASLKAEITKLWEPELKLYREAVSGENIH